MMWWVKEIYWFCYSFIFFKLHFLFLWMLQSTFCICILCYYFNLLQMAKWPIDNVSKQMHEGEKGYFYKSIMSINIPLRTFGSDMIDWSSNNMACSFKIYLDILFAWSLHNNHYIIKAYLSVCPDGFFGATCANCIVWDVTISMVYVIKGSSRLERRLLR